MQHSDIDTVTAGGSVSQHLHRSVFEKFDKTDEDKIELLIKRKNVPDTLYSLKKESYNIEGVSVLSSNKKTKVPDNILYVKIPSFFNPNVKKDFYDVMNSLDDVKCVIADLRGNAGGEVGYAVTIANMLLQDKMILSIIDRTGKREDIKANGHLLTDKPLILLADRDSASSSEILVAALKENNRALVIGDNTYGKGIMQERKQLPDGAGMNITTKYYLTPNGNYIHKKGVAPDILVKNKGFKNFLGYDVQLEKAIDMALKTNN